MAAEQQNQGIVRTTTLYPEAVIPQIVSRRSMWGPFVVGLLLVGTAGIALSWSLGLTGLRESEPTIDDNAVLAPAASPRSPYPTEIPNLARHPVRSFAPPPSAAEAAPIAEPQPIAVARPVPLPAPMPKPLTAPRREPISALPLVPPNAKPRTPATKPLLYLTGTHPPTAVRATARPRALPGLRAAQPLFGPLADLFGPNDYPAAARRNGERGDVTVRLAVGSDGRVSGCRILAADASATLKAATCAILIQRARFAAAIDARGAATDGAFVQHVAWRLP